MKYRYSTLKILLAIPILCACSISKPANNSVVTPAAQTHTPIPAQPNTQIPPSDTPVLTATPTMPVLPTITDTSMPMPVITLVPTGTPTPNKTAKTFYLSPTGDDHNSGKTETSAWATFDHAWKYLYPGDSLILLDGVYTQSLNPNVRNGKPGAPITIRAKNDGKAIIDGEFKRLPVKLGDTWPGPIGDYFVIEGIVAKNSSGSVYLIRGNNNIFRRVSGYNAYTDGNEHVFLIWANNNLIEDCVAAGSGRKMIVVFASTNDTGQHNTIRRCFGSYREWDGRYWHDEWPWNENFEAYNGDYNIFENDIAYGFYPNAGFSLLSNGPTADIIGNKILGSIAMMGGRDFEGNAIQWGNIRPQPTDNSLITDLEIPAHRSGFIILHDGLIQDNFLQDILAWGNASVGIKVASVQKSNNNNINRATIINNGLGLPYGGVDAFQDDLSQLTITNSRIDLIKSSDWTHSPYPAITGEGARLQFQYIDGVLRDGSDGTQALPLWPWPMEQRIRDELGISVTDLIASIIPDQISPIPDSNRQFLSVSPPFLPFSPVTIGQSLSRQINLKNTGTAPLTVDRYQFGNGNPAFSVTSGSTCANPPFTLAPSQDCSVEITFNPNNAQAQTDDLYFYSANLAPYPSVPGVYVSGIGN